MEFDPYQPYGPLVETTVRVVTWNVWGRYGEFAVRDPLIEAELRLGRWDEAERSLLDALESQAASGVTEFNLTLPYYKGMLAMRQGNYEPAESTFRDTLAKAEARECQLWEAHLCLALGELCERHPALVRMLLDLEVSRLRAMLVAFSAFSTQSLEQRLAGRLLGLSESFGTKEAQGVALDLRLSQESMAQLIGATRQRVNQVLKQWEQQGLIRQRYGQLLLLRPDALQTLAQERPDR